MNDNIPIYGSQTGTALSAERNQVLRNTYWLLALSMVPTVLGAWAGVATGAAVAGAGDVAGAGAGGPTKAGFGTVAERSGCSSLPALNCPSAMPGPAALTTPNCAWPGAAATRAPV